MSKEDEDEESNQSGELLKCPIKCRTDLAAEYVQKMQAALLLICVIYQYIPVDCDAIGVGHQDEGFC